MTPDQRSPEVLVNQFLARLDQAVQVLGGEETERNLGYAHGPVTNIATQAAKLIEE